MCNAHLGRSIVVVSALLLAACSSTYDLPELNKLSFELVRDGTTSFQGRKIERKCELPAGYQLDANFDIQKHLVVSDSEGKMPDERHKGSVGKAFRVVMGNFAKQHAAALAAQQPPPRLLFYLNGGLNSQEFVERQAARQIPCMLADGFYPVFFVWDTHGLKTYAEQVTSIHEGQRFTGGAVRWRTPFRVMGDVFSGVGDTPVDLLVHGRRFWRAARRMPHCGMTVVLGPNDGCANEQIVKFVGNNGVVTTDRNILVDKGRVDVDPSEIGRLAAYGALFPVRVLTTPFAHGFGEEAWSNMIRRTRVTVRRSVEYNLDWLDPDTGRKCPESFRDQLRRFPEGTGVFARFFKLLDVVNRGNLPDRALWRCNETTTPKIDMPAPIPSPAADREMREIGAALRAASIVFVGHSMGTIVINELVQRFPDLPYSDIVFMAAAASVRETQRMLDGYMAGPGWRERRFYSLMLHPLNDARERQALGAVPSGSLLVWIDEMFEVPKVPEDRVFGYWPSAKAARRFLGDRVQERTLFRVFNRPQAGSGEFPNPVQHGDFNDDEMCFWRPAFWGAMDTNWDVRFSDLPAQTRKRCLPVP